MVSLCFAKRMCMRQPGWVCQQLDVLSPFSTNMTSSPSRVWLSPSNRCFSKKKIALTSTSYRPFQVLGVQQIAIGSLRRSSMEELWLGVLGLAPVARHRIERENVEEDILSLGKEPWAVEIDLMTPIDPEKTPKVHVPALNHIGLWVDNLPGAVEWMHDQGVRFTPGGIRQGAAGHLVAFIHPKPNDAFPLSGNGVLIELVQAPDAVIEAYTAERGE